MGGKGKWANTVAWLYYVLGFVYYLAEWSILIGVGSLISVAFVPTPRYLFVGGISVGVLTTAAGVMAWVIRTRRRLQVVNPLLDIISLHETYAQADEITFSFESRMATRAAVSGVSSYYRKYHWSGEGNNRVWVEPREFTLQQSRSPDGLWQLIEIRFPHPLKKGESYSFVIKMHLLDTKRTALPLFGKAIDDIYPNGLIMTVRVPSPARFSRILTLGPRSDVPIYLEEHNSPSSEHTWPLKRPRIGWRYRITWLN